MKTTTRVPMMDATEMGERDMLLFDRIIDYEQCELDHAQMVALFADLVRTGLAWHLQGSYGRTAQSLIEAGYITRSGDVIDPEPEG